MSETDETRVIGDLEAGWCTESSAGAELGPPVPIRAAFDKRLFETAPESVEPELVRPYLSGGRQPLPIDTGGWERVPGYGWDPSLREQVSMQGLYETMLWTAWQYATDADRARINEVRAILERTEALGDRFSEHLDRARAQFAVHTLTGRTLLRMRGSLLGRVTVSGIDFDEVLNLRRFVADPLLRVEVIEHLGSSPVGALFRVTLIDTVRALATGNMPALSGSISSAMSQVERFDAVGASEMVDLAVACLLPPVQGRG